MTDTLTMREAELHGTIDYTRGRGFFDPTAANLPPLTVIGAGGIGSPLVMALAKMGWPEINVVDGDTVERHNLPNQMFPLNSIGRPKVEVLAEEVARYSPSRINAVHRFVEDEWPFPGRPRGIVVLALDSIDVRKAIYERHLRHNPLVQLVIDPRLGGQNIVCYTLRPVDPLSIAAYEATLHSAEEAVEAPCTMRSIIDVGFMVTSYVTRVARRFVAGEEPEPMFWWKQDTAERKA
jgi:hypothetical protein